MKHINSFFCAVLMLISNLDINGNDQISPQKFVIGYGDYFGLFTAFFGTLNWLACCDEDLKIPVVYWGKGNPYYIEPGYNGSKNAWEYYFEPVSGLNYQEGDEITTEFWNSKYRDYLRTDIPVPAGRDGSREHFSRKNIILPTNGEKQAREMFDRQYLKEINSIITKFVKVKPVILDKVESFYNTYMRGKKTVALHLRGTDKWKDGIATTDPLNIIKYAQQFKNCQFLVATDEEKFLTLAKQELKGAIIYYDARRSTVDVPLHLIEDANNNKAAHGEEVLIEVLLLSKCDLFLHTCSNVSTAALIFNPELKHLLFTPSSTEPYAGDQDFSLSI
jgi:hypothetical protein